MKVGIPRALLIYRFYPIWNHFLLELGVDTVISPPTSKLIMDIGTKTTVDDACLPVKLFHGHVKYLLDKVEAIFIPRLMSITPKEFICPKFCGLPEMVKNRIDIKIPTIVLDHNLHNSRKTLLDSYMEFGKYFCEDKKKIVNAFKKASMQQAFFNQKVLDGAPPDILIENLYQDIEPFDQRKGTIGVIGHPYVLYDHFISMNILNKLARNKIKYITPEMIPDKTIELETSELPKRMFWSFGKNILGSAKFMLKSMKLDGLIYCSSFGCGIDSLIVDMVERIARKESVPFLVITLDEHTGEAGVDTRLEAFLDMVYWRNENEGNISPYGERIHTNKSFVG